MLRLLLAGALVTGVALSNAPPASALDYQEPVVPQGFLRVAPPVPTSGGVVATGPDVRFRLSRGDSAAAVSTESLEGRGVAWERYGMAGQTGFIPHNQWDDNGGGCAVWNWNTC
jgi:hypothetical protein